MASSSLRASDGDKRGTFRLLSGLFPQAWSNDTLDDVVHRIEMMASPCLQRWPNNDDYAADIFRFADEGKIVEHWDRAANHP